MKLIYEVQKGDTLCSISRKFNITCDKIIELNQITNSDDLKQGDLILIRYIDDNEYYVKMIYDIILQYNRIKGNIILESILNKLKNIINKKYNRKIDIERNSTWQQ